METSRRVPDAWDDDWVSSADKSSTAPLDPLPSSTTLTKAERRARQAELNKQIWQDAETPKDSFFLNTRGEVPLKSDFKPAMKVLSRKPRPKTANTAASPGSGQNTLDDDDDDDENDAPNTTMTTEERQLKAQREREEKQKKYEEARERLFGAEAAAGTPPTSNAVLAVTRQNGESRSRSRNKGTRESRPSSSAGIKSRQLYDPNYSVKSDSIYIQKQESLTSSGRSAPNEQQPIRNPRGPDDSGRGGFGISPRGGRGA
ncbi:hypothetical protein MMC07_000126 [Pseudocyphellaria aurata]|nr:hypothetical protein [Pseudocyphellaria aurata]